MKNPFDDPMLRESLRRSQELRNNPAYREWERQQNDPNYRAMMKEIDRRQNDPNYNAIIRELDRPKNDPVYQNIRKFEEDIRNYHSGIEIYNVLQERCKLSNP